MGIAENTGGAAPLPGGAQAADDLAWQEDLLFQLRLDAARIPRRFLNKAFSSFKVERSRPRKEALQAAGAYAEAFNFVSGAPNGLILKGGTGCGKTHLAVAILQAVIRKGYSGLYFNMPDLLLEIRSTFESGAAQSEHELLAELNEPDLLVLDDLGAEKTAEWVNDRLYLIINRRYECCKPILVTTNLGLDELSAKLGERIVSRLCEISEYFDTFPAEDYRKKHMR